MKTLLKILLSIMDGIDYLSETQTWHEGEGADR